MVFNSSIFSFLVFLYLSQGIQNTKGLRQGQLACADDWFRLLKHCDNVCAYMNKISLK